MRSEQRWKRVAQLLFVFISIALLFMKVDLGAALPDGLSQEYFEGEVTQMRTETQIQILDVLLKSGQRSGETVTLTNDVSGYANGKSYQTGDEVVLVEYKDELGNGQLYVVDYMRLPHLLLLFLFFVGMVLLISRKKGAYSLLGMAFSFLVLFKLVLPLILKGTDPVFTALLGSLFILPAVFYLSHGFNKKTSIAITGTLITLGITGFLAAVFAELTQLSGLSSEEAGFLKVGIGTDLNFKGLLLAGMIISALGVLDDVTITQTAVIQELKAAQKDLSFNDLYTRGMTIGRDHIASVVNTLILVYTGASLPLLLLFINSSESIGQILNYEFMTEEIVRTLVGSIGLICAIPITTLIASFVFCKGDDLKHDLSNQ